MMTSLSLIALAAGYLVFVVAAKEKEGIKIAGQVIAIFVMVASLLLFLASFCPKARSGWGSCPSKAYGCAFKAKSGSQPICPLSGS